MTDLAWELLAYLQQYGSGASNAQSRRALAAALDCGDRSLRRAITELREHGYPIVGSPQGRGYYLAATPAEAEAARRILLSYIRSMARQVRALERGFDLDQARLPLEV
ncbi:MAG: HTH domain-containing protein [Armatimonadetes bacterium]|nr:HTH domain-containing protein [Armatimonadota bacterium]